MRNRRHVVLKKAGSQPTPPETTRRKHKAICKTVLPKLSLRLHLTKALNNFDLTPCSAIPKFSYKSMQQPCQIPRQLRSKLELPRKSNSISWYTLKPEGWNRTDATEKPRRGEQGPIIVQHFWLVYRVQSLFPGPYLSAPRTF